MALLPADPVREALLAAMGAIGERQPNIDFALVAASRILGLPQGSALGLFALGRSVGWIAHALEQHETGSLIRPRTRYVGATPED